GLPAEVARLVRQCLAKAPSDRPPAVAAARILRQAAGLPPLTRFTALGGDPVKTVDTPTQPVAPPTLDTEPRPGRRRLVDRYLDLPARKVKTGAALTALLMVAGLLGWA